MQAKGRPQVEDDYYLTSNEKTMIASIANFHDKGKRLCVLNIGGVIEVALA